MFISVFHEIHVSKQNSPQMGRCVLRRRIWGYSVCLCPIKRTPSLYGLKAVNNTEADEGLPAYSYAKRFSQDRVQSYVSVEKYGKPSWNYMSRVAINPCFGVYDQLVQAQKIIA